VGKMTCERMDPLFFLPEGNICTARVQA